VKRVLVVENSGIETLAQYPRILKEEGAEVQVFKSHAMKERDGFPPVEDYDGFIFGAMPEDVHERDDHYWMIKEWAYLQEIIDSGKPVFGLCGGGQYLAYRLGAKVGPCPREIGVYTITLTEDGAKDPLFKGLPREYKGFLWHGNTFQVPKGGKLTATGDPCPREGFVKDNVRGFLFHFEVTGDDLEKWMDHWENGLSAVDKTRDQIISNVRAAEDEMLQNARIVARNFLALMG
jgi:GMP synthase (glutamine-hydrolysing)